MTSMERFADYDSQKEDVITRLRMNATVKGQPIDTAILAILEKEIEIKVGAYFNFLSGESVSLGDYLFTEFENVFKVLLVYALFRRYHGNARDLHGAVYFDRIELLHHLAIATLQHLVTRQTVGNLGDIRDHAAHRHCGFPRRGGCSGSVAELFRLPWALDRPAIHRHPVSGPFSIPQIAHGFRRRDRPRRF